MKTTILVSALVTLFSLSGFAQYTKTGVELPADGKPAEFTEWEKVEFTLDGASLSYEYRIAFQGRKGLACNYEVQVKNTSTQALKIKVKSHYYDKLVKGNYGDDYKATIKPEKVQGFAILTQGCKADKEKGEQTDFQRCKNCDFSYEIIADF